MPLISAPYHIPENKFAQAIDYSEFTVEKPKLKSSMDFNTITTEELIKENNIKILDRIYKTLE